jgi:hypothetical protein
MNCDETMRKSDGEPSSIENRRNPIQAVEAASEKPSPTGKPCLMIVKPPCPCERLLGRDSCLSKKQSLAFGKHESTQYPARSTRRDSSEYNERRMLGLTI